MNPETMGRNHPTVPPHEGRSWYSSFFRPAPRRRISGFHLYGGGNRDGDFLKVVITEKEKAAIERGLNQGGGAPEVIIKIENGKVVVLKVKKEKIS